MVVVLAVLAAGCGRSDFAASVPGNETDSTTVSFDDDGPVPDTGESLDWGEEETDDWSEEESGWSEETDWGEEEWGEETQDWGESTEEWGEETDWGESSSSTDTGTSTSTSTSTSTTDTGTTDTTTDTGTTDTTTDTGTTDTTTDTGTTDDTTTDTGGDPTCGDATDCLIDCGDYTNQCVGPCTQGLGGQEQGEFFDLQICALQVCFFLGECGFNFNDPQCVDCRLFMSENPPQQCEPAHDACYA
jgi:hypothetical protein